LAGTPIAILGIIVDDEDVPDFEKTYLASALEHPFRVVTRLATKSGLSFVLCRLHEQESVTRFAMRRLSLPNVKWPQDWVDNNEEDATEEILEAVNNS